MIFDLFTIIAIILVLFTTMSLLISYRIKHALQPIQNKNNDDLNQIINSFQKSLNPEYFADMIKNLQAQTITTNMHQIFQAPKSRGRFGEEVLECLLSDILPKEHLSFQHCFSTNVICDVVVLLSNNRKLSIDSKFPLDNYLKSINASNEQEAKDFTKSFNQDIKKHIDDISKKYIVPADGTMNFAFMFIPAEGVYYKAFIEDENNNELILYARKNNVYVVSPQILYVYLQLVLRGLQGFSIEQNAYKIQQDIITVMQDLEAFNKEYEKLKDKLDQAQKNFTAATKFFEKIQFKLQGINELKLVENPFKKE